MKITRFFICIFALLICCSGCNSGDITESLTELSNEDSLNSIPEESDISDYPAEESSEASIEVSFEESLKPDYSLEESREEEPQEDILSLLGDHGKDIVTHGEFDEAEIAKLEAILDGYSHNISLVAYSIDNKKLISYNTEARLFCASAIKAPYALYCCLEMEKGNGSLDTELVYEEKHYESGTGDMQYQPYGTVFDLETIINKTLGISDNVGYLMMTDYFGREGYNQWVEDIGAASLQISPTVWSLKASAKDFALIWREYYNYFKTESQYADFLYNACTNTGNNYATANFADLDYSHKHGHNRSGGWHAYCDAGIIWQGEYIIVILTDAPGPSDYEQDTFNSIMNIIHQQF